MLELLAFICTVILRLRQSLTVAAIDVAALGYQLEILSILSTIDDLVRSSTNETTIDFDFRMFLSSLYRFL